MGEDPCRYQDGACLLFAVVQAPHLWRQEDTGSHSLLFSICHLRSRGLKRHLQDLEKVRLGSEREKNVFNTRF